MALTIPNSISNGAALDASKVQQNFDAVGTYINGSMPVTTDLTAAVPVGVLQMFAGAAAPNANWLLCQGQAISRATYATLFTAISTTYGVGDGTTTFNLPDMRGRVPVGVGTGSGLTARALAATGGEELHTLTAGESGTAVHNHGVTDPSHTHQWNKAGSGSSHLGEGTVGSSTVSTGFNDFNSPNTTGVTVNNHAGASAGSGHNTMQPFIAVNYIIKAL